MSIGRYHRTHEFRKPWCKTGAVMTSYSWAAKDRNGRPVVREVLAETSAESKAILEAEGCTELKLMEDEISAAVRAGFPGRLTASGLVVRTTAADRLRHRGKP